MFILRKSMVFLAAGLLFVGIGCGDDDGGTTPDKTGSAELTLNKMCGTGGLDGATVSYTGGTELTSDANGKVMVDKLAPGEYTFKITKKGYLPNEIKVTVTADQVSTGSADMECQSLVVAEAARAFLKKHADAKNAPITKAKAVFDLFTDGDDTNDPLVVSVRGAEDYKNGHVPTSINIGWKAIADDDQLAKLGTPGDKEIVDYCYTGHTGGIASTILNLLGYPTKNMKYGLAAWTDDATARGPKSTNPDIDTNDFTIEKTDNPGESKYEAPWLEYDNVTTADEAVKAAAKAYLSNGDMAPVITAKALFDNLNDGDASNDPFIISVRKPEHYAKGHIPGAINIPWTQIALEENLAKIPTDRQVVVYCYTGHTGAIATSVLGALGYHNVTNMKYGMAGWTQDEEVRATGAFNPANDAKDFPIVTGTEPGAF